MASIDVAMQSTSEEILEKVEQIDSVVTPEAVGYQCVAGLISATETKTTTLLTVTGKGRLRGLMVYDYHPTKNATKIEIILDGVSYVLQVKTSNTSGGYKYIGLINPSDVWVQVSGSNSQTSTNWFGAIFHSSIYPTYQYDMFIQDLDNITHSGTAYNVGMWMYLDNYIPFKESLVIKFTTNTTNSDARYGLCYRLDD